MKVLLPTKSNKERYGTGALVTSGVAYKHCDLAACGGRAAGRSAGVCVVAVPTTVCTCDPMHAILKVVGRAIDAQIQSNLSKCILSKCISC